MLRPRSFCDHNKSINHITQHKQAINSYFSPVGCDNLSMMVQTVILEDYRSFCFRGEGRCNIVISAKGCNDNCRIVWRLAKKRKSGLINYKPKCWLINTYLEKFISPFLNSDYLIKAKLVQIDSQDLYYLAKVPYLDQNVKIESFEGLTEETKFLASRFPENKYYDGSGFVCALEMPDATRIPRQFPFVIGPTITFELKPKQGSYQTHPGIDLPFCNNCILQIEKWKSSDFCSMYDFCPLALYSGDRSRMCKSLDSLITDPHRNLRIFVDGNVIHDERTVMTHKELNDFFTLRACPNANIQILVTAVSCILAGVFDDRWDREHGLGNGSVLQELLKAQQLDNIGIVRAYEYYKSLSPHEQHELRGKSNLLSKDLSFLSKKDARSLVERYLLAATMKDCSLMISIRLTEQLSFNENTMSTSGGTGCVCVHAFDGRPLYFAYSVRIVDLDPKSAKNLENAYSRFMNGVRFIRANPGIHRPCL